MPTPSLTLWIDSANNRALSGWQSNSVNSGISLRYGDNVGVEVHWIDATNGTQEIAFPSSLDMTMAIGLIDAAPLSGYFSLSYNGATTANIASNSTEIQVETALNSLSTITSDGGVYVNKYGNSYRVMWNNVGVRSNLITVASNELFPTCSIDVSSARAGSSSLRQTTIIHAKQSPVSNVTSFVEQDSATISVVGIHTPAYSGDWNVWRVSISPQPKSGTFLLSWNNGTTVYRTGPIDVSTDASTLSTLLSAVNNESWFVIKTGAYSWDISSQTTGVFGLSVAGSGIVSFDAKYGVLNMNTAEVGYLLSGAASTSAILAIEATIGGAKMTLLQTPCTITNDIIDTSLYNVVTWGSVMPVDSVVRFDTSQSLTDLQKLQAQSNIGIDLSPIPTIQAKDIELEGRLVVVEANTVTTNQKAALNANTTLSSTNKVADNTSLTTGLAGKAASVHTHAISDVTSLQAVLDGKAALVHTHSPSDILGLTTLLGGKVDIGSDTTLGTLTLTGGIVLPSSSVGTNPVTSYNVTNFPNMITISVNGVTYGIPAKLL